MDVYYITAFNVQFVIFKRNTNLGLTTPKIGFSFLMKEGVN